MHLPDLLLPASIFIHEYFALLVLNMFCDDWQWLDLPILVILQTVIGPGREIIQYQFIGLNVQLLAYRIILLAAFDCGV